MTSTCEELTRETASDATSSFSGVREGSGSEISGALGQGKCNSLNEFNSLVWKVCHLVGFNLALEPVWVNKNAMTVNKAAGDKQTGEKCCYMHRFK